MSAPSNVSSSRRRLFLVDGNNNIYRAHHSLRNFSNSKGMATGATYGFTLMLRKLMREESPDLLAVCFDKTEMSFRHQIFADYKANRDAVPEEIVAQLAVIREVTSALGVAIVEMDDVEADDIIGTYAARARDEADLDVVIVSTDKDLMQLVGPGCTLFDTMKDVRYGVDEVQTKTGVRPKQIVDWLALMGDKVDNIPGVPGIGKKTAATLLDNYESLDGVYAAIEAGDKAIKGKRLENLVNHRDDAYLSQTLATLKLDIEVPVAIADLALKAADRPQLAALFGKMEFRNFEREFSDGEVAAIEVPEAAAAETTVPDLNLGKKGFELVRSQDRLDAWCDRLKSASRVGLSTATTSEHPMRAALVGLAFAVDHTEACYIPVGHNTLESVDQLPLALVLDRLRPWLEDKDAAVVVSDYKRERQILQNQGIELAGVHFDVKLASYLVDPDKYHDHTLSRIVADRIGHTSMSMKDLAGTGRKALSIDRLGLANARDFFCERAQTTLAVEPVLGELLERASLTSLMTDLEIPLSEVLSDMEMTGIAIDEPVLAAISQELGERAQTLEAECHALATTEFSVGSPKQLGEILFKKLGLPAKKRTKTGYSTDNSVLEELAELHDLPAKVMQWRSITKLKSTYSDALPALVHPTTGRIHTTFNQAVAATGRLSSAEPNLQNIPVRTPEGRRIRDAFVATDGCVLLAADYSQIELRILAHLCGSDAMRKTFQEGADIHSRTAAEIFEVAEDQVTRGQRAMAKTINFGVLYGMGVWRLAREQGISRTEAKNFIERYFSRYPAIREWKNTTLESARQEGFVQTLFGRVRRLPDMHATNRAVRAFAERVAVNTPVQGSAADIIKTAMIRIAEKLQADGLKTRMLLQVHDELVFEVPNDEVASVKDWVVQAMEGVVSLDVPLSVNAATGHTWLQAH